MAKLFWKKHISDFSLVPNLSIAEFYGFYGNELQFGYPDSSGADRLDNEGSLYVVLPHGLLYKLGIFVSCQFTFRFTKKATLDAQGLKLELEGANIFQKTIHSSKNSVYGGRGIAENESFFPLNQQRLGQDAVRGKSHKADQIPAILFGGLRAAFLFK